MLLKYADAVPTVSFVVIIIHFRVEKTEVLSDDLQSSEKRVDTVKHVTSNTIKKLGSSLLSAGSSDPEKRLVSLHLL